MVTSPLSATNSLSPLFREGADSGLRVRLSAMSPRSSPRQYQFTYLMCTVLN